MGEAKAIDVLFAILILLILTVVIVFAFYFNIKGASYDTRNTVIDSFRRISTSLGMSYRPSYVPSPHNDNFKTPDLYYNDSSSSGHIEESGTYSGITGDSTGQYTYIGKNTCTSSDGSDCVYKYNPTDSEENTMSNGCLFKDEYYELCNCLIDND